MNWELLTVCLMICFCVYSCRPGVWRVAPAITEKVEVEGGWTYVCISKQNSGIALWCDRVTPMKE